jgi:acyl-CoA thioester hydrolase
MPDLIPTFSTAVNTWQCDENNHLNVQFYTDFAHRASALMLASLGFGPRAQRTAGLSVDPVQDHVKYLREFRLVEPVEVHSGAVEIGRRELLAYHEIRNAKDSSVAATVLRKLVCSGDWPESFVDSVEKTKVAVPAFARPRSVGTLTLPDLTLANAASHGLITVGRSLVLPEQCDERGRLLPRHIFGLYSDGAPVLWNHLGFDRAGMQERQEGSVVVEMLNDYREPLVAGDLVVVMSGLADFSDKILKFAHFLFEAETGRLAACAEAVGMKFDQKIRKIMIFPPDDRARLNERKVRL